MFDHDVRISQMFNAVFPYLSDTLYMQFRHQPCNTFLENRPKFRMKLSVSYNVQLRAWLTH